MKTKLTLIAAILGWSVTSYAHDHSHADDDAHHAYHDYAAADAADEHTREAYEHAADAARRGDFYHAYRDYQHAAQDSHSARHARDHADAAEDHADESYSESRHRHHGH